MPTSAPFRQRRTSTSEPTYSSRHARRDNKKSMESWLREMAALRPREKNPETE